MARILRFLDGSRRSSATESGNFWEKCAEYSIDRIARHIRRLACNGTGKLAEEMKTNFLLRPSGEPGRIKRQRKTIAAMIRIYCRGHHASRDPLCDNCARLHGYVMCRLDRCPFGVDKTSCANCLIHCYKANRREEIREVMRYAGPRMLWQHPVLALGHLLDGRRKPRPLEKDATPTATRNEPAAR